MTALPHDWPVARLDEIADVRLGRQRSPKNHDGDQMRQYVRAANVGWSGLILDDVKSMNFTDAEMEVYRLERGDLLLNEASGSSSEVGKPALWRGEIEECAFQNTLLRVRPRKVAPEFLLKYFQHQAATGKLAAAARGVGIHHLGREALAAWPVPVPPVEEQRRIVDVLDRVDELRAKRRDSLAQTDVLYESVFSETVRSDLSGQGGAMSRPLGELIEVKSGSFLPAGRMRDGAHPVYGGNGISGYHDEYLFDDSKIVIGRVGAYCGCVHVTVPRSWVTDNALYVKWMSPSLVPSYLAYALKAANLNRCASQSGQPLISASRIYDVKVPVPSIAAQQIFDKRVVVVEQMAVAYRASLAELDALFASVQDRAFRGEL